LGSVALDAGFVEAAHFAVEAGGEADQWECERGAAGFAEAQAQVEQRLEAEFGEDVVVCGFGGAVSGDEVIA
jgi:hypothetical protein